LYLYQNGETGDTIIDGGMVEPQEKSEKNRSLSPTERIQPKTVSNFLEIVPLSNTLFLFQLELPPSIVEEKDRLEKTPPANLTWTKRFPIPSMLNFIHKYLRNYTKLYNISNINK